MIKLEQICAVQPSTYNPRKADPRRLDIIELSLRKLGFLLPIYSDANGEILSGHQRHHVATRIGLKNIPVAYTEAMDLEQRKAINIAFNRGTNDLTHNSTPKTMTDALKETGAFDIGAALPDIDPEDHKKMFRCMYPTMTKTVDLVNANHGRWVKYSYRMAKMLGTFGVAMPIVCTPDNVVVNGIGRLQLLSEREEEFSPVVYISHEEAAFSNAMLNLLSMDFDLHNRYSDTLRYNSFRRARRVRSELGLGFIFMVAPNTPAKEFDVTTTVNRSKWIRQHGKKIVDFGAGHFHETDLLRSIGVDVYPFEPYRIKDGQDDIDRDLSISTVLKFLDDVESGQEFTSIFISSVLNSVPFAKDREHIACICAALCSPKTVLYALATGADHTNIKQVKGLNSLNERQSSALTFLLEYEPNITLADFKGKPKVQKYHSPEEFYNLFKPFFKAVKVQDGIGQNVHAICVGANDPDPVRLAQALEFEFDLPYPDGSKMGLVLRAKEAFSKRLGKTI